MKIDLTPEQREFVVQKAARRRDDCAGVLTENYMQQFPVANSAENIAARHTELDMLDDLLAKLNYKEYAKREEF